MLDKVLIIANPTAGKEQADVYAQSLQKVLQTTHQAEADINYTEKPGDATKWAALAYQSGYDSVFALGGDGTVAEVVQGLMQNEERPNFGFIPLGTVNDLARALGYHLDPQQAVEAIKSVRLSTLDIGKVNNSYFINVIALGPIAESVMTTSIQDKSKMGILAYVKDGIQGLLSDDSMNLEIKDSSGKIYHIDTNLLLIGLTNSVGSLERVFPEATYNDGLLHLIATKRSTPISTIEAGLAVGFNNENSNSVLKVNDKSFYIRAKNNEEFVTNIDGDEGSKLPIHVEVIRAALQVIIYK